MERKARLTIISQILRAGKRKIEHAKEHCINGGVHTHIDLVLSDLDRVLKEISQYKRECE